MIKIIESLVTFVTTIAALIKPPATRKDVPPCCKCPYLNKQTPQPPEGGAGMKDEKSGELKGLE